jgi:hypothetical protein
MALVFEEAILNARADIPLMGADRVRSAVGDDIYESMLDQFKWKGEVSASTLDSVRTALVDSVRYLVVAGIEKERTSHDIVERDTDYDFTNYNPKPFKVSTRTVEVGFRVYDLHDGKLAWPVRQIDSEENEVEVPKILTIFNQTCVRAEATLSDDRCRTQACPMCSESGGVF